MATLLTPYYQALDANGIPLAGATLAVYIAGTTTPATIYQDEGGTTPHDNPVVASSPGLFPAIFLDTGDFKTVLKDSSGVTVQTIDGIKIAPPGGVNDGDKSDVVVSDEGETWTLKPVTNDKLSDSIVDARTIDGDDKLPMLAKLGSEVRRANLVDKLLAGVSIRGMYVRPWVSGGNTVGIYVGLGMAKDYNSVVEYQFLLNDDDLLLSLGAKAGREDDTTQSIEPTLSGTYVTSGAPASYTVTTNDTFSFSFTGSCFFFHSTTDNRGGVWEFVLSSGAVKRVSTYSATTTTQRILVFDGLPHATYQVKATFLGADPINAPSGGTARGWIWYESGSSTNKAIHVGKVKLPSSAAEDVFSQNSVPDFAISARPDNQPGYTARWVPEHGGVSGVSGSIQFKLLVDGVTISSTAGDLTALTEYRECETVEIIQQFNALNPAGGGTMWVHTISHTIKKNDPRLRIRNRIVVSQDTYVTEGYLAMLPSDSDHVVRLVLNNGVEVSPVPSDGSSDSFGFDVSSAMFSGEYGGTAGNYHAVAITVSSLQEASSLGRRLQPETPGYLDYRSSTIAKVYWRLVEPGSTLLAGEVYACEHDIAVATGIRSPNVNVAVI